MAPPTPSETGRALLRLLPLLLAILYAIGLAFLWVAARGRSPGLPPMAGDPGAYLAVAILGLGVLLTLMFQEWRIRKLEQHLRDLNARPPAPGSPGAL